MRRLFVTLLIYCIFFCSCRTIRPKHLVATPPNTTLLPRLIPLVKISTFNDAYSDRPPRSKTNKFYMEVSDDVIHLDSITNKNKNIDKRTNDGIEIFRYDVENNISLKSADTSGYILCDITSCKIGRNPTFNIICSYLFYLPSLIDFPSTVIHTSIELRATIYNKDHKFIKSYYGHGKGTACVAMYWGYGVDCSRKSSLIAIKNAMTEIKANINSDAVMLSGALEN